MCKLYTFIFTTLFLIGSSFSYGQTNRTVDGYGNNTANPEWGAAVSPFNRITGNGYGDGYASPGGTTRPNPRTISVAFGAQTQFTPNELGLSDYIWGWGQFIDHDVNLNDDHPTEFIPIAVPIGDPEFDPNLTGTVEIPMKRSLYDPNTGNGPGDLRKHINEITAFIDGSTVYGSDQDRIDWLRSNVDGKLKTSAGNLLPFNTIDNEQTSMHDPDAPFMIVDGMTFSDALYVGGDVRINEHPGLTCFHTLFVREHNRLCDEIKAENPAWNDEQIFQKARKMVGAYIQAITFEEWLPVMGFVLPDYTGYDPTINPGISNVFSAAGYRFGHTMINGRLVRLEEGGDTLNFGSLNLRDGFFNTEIIVDEGGIEPFFRGMASQEHQFVDTKIMDDIRNFLFGPPDAGGLDLLSININRARERGLMDFNTIRQEIGLPALTTFADLTSDTDLQATFQSVYGSVDEIDPWIGFMAEDHLPGTILGQTLYELLMQQFLKLRDGDRFYYENDPTLTQAELDVIKNIKLSDIIKRNTDIQVIQENVFIAQPTNTVAIELIPFKNIRNMEIKAYPNPVQKYFTLTINAFDIGSAELSIIDNAGKVALTKQVALQKGKNTLEFELDDQLANGLYTIFLKSADDNIGQLKIIKLKE